MKVIFKDLTNSQNSVNSISTNFAFNVLSQQKNLLDFLPLLWWIELEQLYGGTLKSKSFYLYCPSRNFFKTCNQLWQMFFNRLIQNSSSFKVKSRWSKEKHHSKPSSLIFYLQKFNFFSNAKIFSILSRRYTCLSHRKRI